MLTMTVPAQFETQLRHIAEIEKTPTNDLIDMALATFIEDYLDSKAIKETWQAVERGEEKLLTMAEVKRRLDELDN